MKTITQPQLPSNLSVLDSLLPALLKDESPSGFTAVAQDMVGVRIKTPVLSEARIDRLMATEADFEKIGLRDVILTHSDFTATNCADGSWLRVRLDDGRCSGIKLHGSTLRNVVFEGCKLDLSNFRAAELKDVLFKDCILDEVDFYNAKLDTVSFEHCSLQKAEFSATKCKNVDLRSSDLTEIRGIEGLAGATIDSLQLVTLSRALAAHFNIHVRD